MHNMPFTPKNLGVKLFFIIVPLIFLFPNSMVTKYQRILILIGIFTLYCPYYTYNVSIVYIFASIQVYFVISNILLLKKRDYLIYSFLIFVSSIIAAIYSKNPYSTNPYLDYVREDFIENFISLYALCFLSYFYSHSKRIDFLIKEFRFSSLGKTSSFLIHEMSKPMLASSENESKQDLKELINLSRVMMGGSIPSSEYQEINIFDEVDKLIQRFIPASIQGDYPIKIKIDIDKNNTFFTSPKAFEIIISNLLKNAIESLAPFVDTPKALDTDKFTISIGFDKSSDKSCQTLTITNFILDESNLKNYKNWDEINYTTKKSHHGVGLYIVKTLAEKTNLKINKNLKDDLISFEISYKN